MEIPQILQQLGKSQSSPILSQIKQAKMMLKSMGNPQAMLNQVLQQNPQVQQMIQQYGGVDGAISAVCRQKGINPQEVLDILK